MDVLQIVAILVLGIVVHVFGMAAAGWLAGVRPKVVSIFMGPYLLSCNIRGTTFCLGMVPVGGYVKFLNSPKEEEEPGDWLPPVVSLSGNLGGILLLWVFAAVLLGAMPTLQFIPKAYVMIFEGAWKPREIGVPVIVRMFDLIRDGAFLRVCGLFFVGMAASQLLPIPLLNGFNVLNTIFYWNHRLRPVPAWMSLVGLGFSLFMFAGWLKAFYIFFTENY